MIFPVIAFNWSKLFSRNRDNVSKDFMCICNKAKVIYRFSKFLRWASSEDWKYMSLVMRKPVFGACEQVRLKPASAATETSYSLEI